MYINHATQAELTEAFAATRMADPLFHQFCALPVCEKMQHEECMQLFHCFDVVAVSAGEVIYEADSKSDNTIRLIVEGRAEVSSSLMSIYGHLGAGDLFGLFSFLDEDRLHSGTVKAESDMILLCVNRDYFNLITVEDAKLGNLLLRLMFRLLSHMSLKMENEYVAMRHYIAGRHG
ncbi:MAG: cyclic nucleotide-binding domain-containing protein [Mariprofundus sp.]|nr:cyclic nucleotide-binding domain-containing protein [Mariprofundus sp.]